MLCPKSMRHAPTTHPESSLLPLTQSAAARIHMSAVTRNANMGKLQVSRMLSTADTACHRRPC